MTGGAGFIGSHLVEALLDHNCCVTIFDNLLSGRIENLPISPKLRIVNLDIRNAEALSDEGQQFDMIYHLAAVADIVPSIVDPELYFSTNVTGTFNILEYARKNRCKKIIYAASSSCYGIPSRYPTSELHPTDPQYPYALTKYLGEQLVLHWSRLYDIQALSLRLFNVYGRRSRTSGAYGAVLGVFLRQKIANKSLTVVGDGMQSRDFTHVSDVTDAFLLAGASSKSMEVYNVGSGSCHTVLQLASFISSKIEYIPKRPGEPDKTFADISKIRTELGYTPKISLSEGMQEIISHIEEWRDAPLWDSSTIAQATEKWHEYLGKKPNA